MLSDPSTNEYNLVWIWSGIRHRYFEMIPKYWRFFSKFTSWSFLLFCYIFLWEDHRPFRMVIIPIPSTCIKWSHLYGWLHKFCSTLNNLHTSISTEMIKAVQKLCEFVRLTGMLQKSTLIMASHRIRDQQYSKR